MAKREDALRLIGKWLVLGVEGFDADKQDRYKDKTLADCILTDLEYEIGMLPPKVTKVTGSFMASVCNTWEAEDNEE
jgi:hypothetical protein